MSGSSGVDTSIYSTIKGPQPNEQVAAPNPLGMAQGFQNLQRTGLENNQMMQMQTAKLAIGSAAQNAIDPATGQLDENKFLAGVASDPRSAYLANDMANGLAARKLQEAETSTQDLANGIKVADGMTQQMVPLINDPGLTKEKVFDLANSYLAMAPHSAALPIAMNFVKNLPDNIEGPGGLRDYLRQKSLAFENSSKAMKMASPDYEVVQGPQGATFVNKTTGILPQNSPLNGQTVSKGVDPSVLAGTQPGPLSGNQSTVVPSSALLAARGVPLTPGVMTGPSAGPLGSMATPQTAGAGQAAGGGIIPRAAPPQNPLGWGQGPATPQGPIAPPAPAMAATPSPAATPGAYTPNIPPAPKGPTDPIAAMTSGQPYATTPSPAAAKEQEKTVDNWQTQQAALTQKLATDHDITNAIGGMDEALKQFKPGAGGPAAITMATSMKAMARFIGADTDVGKSFSSLGDNLLANPNDPAAGKAALDAAQTFNSQALEARIGKLGGSFASGGTQDEFNSLQQGYLSAANQPGSTASLHDFAKKIYAYDLAKAQAANTYKSAAEGQNGQGSADWNNFAPDFQKYALGHGFGSITPSTNATIPVPGDEQGLLAGVGMHPQAVSHATTVAKPTFGVGATAMRGGVPYVKAADGMWYPKGAQ